jgi:hypothetical protein
MDLKTACDLIKKQTNTVAPEDETFLARLKQFQPPIPGQVTALLLALKVLTDQLKQEANLDRSLANALYRLAYESRQYYEQGRRQGIEWPPLLDEDLTRIAIAITQIFGHSPT